MRPASGIKAADGRPAGHLPPAVFRAGCGGSARPGGAQVRPPGIMGVWLQLRYFSLSSGRVCCPGGTGCFLFCGALSGLQGALYLRGAHFATERTLLFYGVLTLSMECFLYFTGRSFFRISVIKSQGVALPAPGGAVIPAAAGAWRQMTGCEA